MSNLQERRAPSTSRVPLETLVEICGNEPGIPAFEAEAVDVSPRGMHLKTAYLPEDGAPLVCRFENQGREIVVEGVVAWRKESARGGEFGVRFTALDARSVDALRGLVAHELKQDPKSGGSDAGTRVRLHIEGLGSPMKARVRGGGTQKLQVGSNLEFLKVGRKLEIEDLEAGARRTAQIDGVDVVVDPGTQVPQLVVSLRYEGMEEDTPEPSVTDLDDAPRAQPERLRLDPAAVTTSAVASSASEPAEASADDDEEDLEPSDVEARAADSMDEDEEDSTDDEVSAEAFKGKLGVVAGSAGKFAQSAGAAFKRAGVSTFKGMSELLSGAGEKIAALRSKSDQAQAKRTTAAPPGGPMSIEGKHVRQQAPSIAPVTKSGAFAAIKQMPPKKKMAIGAGAAVLCVSVLAIALKPSGSNPPGASAAAANAIQVQAEPTAAPAPVAALPAAPADSAATAAPGASGGVSANVPLFGPTPMATMEPAPLGPSGEGEEEGSVEAEEMAAAKASSKPTVRDEEFTESSHEKPTTTKKLASVDKSDKADKKEASDKKPEDVSPFGRGKVHKPTIHRLRLDGPGSEIRGASEPVGFTVLIPNRKIMEKGAILAKRDPRIAKIRTTNTPGGAQIHLEFKDGVPAYKVRLRRDYVELLISAPEDKPKTSTSTSTPSKTKVTTSTSTKKK